MKISTLLTSTSLALCTTWCATAFGAHGAPIDTRDYAPSVREQGPLPVSPLLEYNSAQIVTTGNEQLIYNMDVNAVVRYPLEGDGPFPVVLYLHGRHSTCDVAGVETLSAGECDVETPQLLGQPTDLINPVDSLKGYDYMANTLASHGYVVISISANDVNDKDIALDAGVNARSQLILHHLDILREINSEGVYTKLDQPYILSELRGKIDMEHIGIMGHSRGGQGVTHVLDLNKNGRGNYFEIGTPEGGDFAAPHNLTAVFALAPTNFDYITAPDTTFAVLLPYCDGDVSNLQGAFMYDDSRFIDQESPTRKFQILTMGANHNFYNTIWTGDDYSNPDSWCNFNSEDNGRDTPVNQQRHGEFLMSSFFRLFVGGEQQFAPFWNGQETMPLDSCPIGTENSLTQRCDDRFHLSIQTPSEERLIIDDVEDATSVSTNDLGLQTELLGFDDPRFCLSSTETGTADADGCVPSLRTWSTAGQLYLSSGADESSLTTLLGDKDVTAYDYFTFRAGIPVLTDANGPLEEAPKVSVVITDTDGKIATADVDAYSKALYIPPGNVNNTEGAKTMLNMVQIPLTAFKTAEGTFPSFEHLQSIALVNTGPSKLQVAEFQFQAIEGALVLPEPEPEVPPQPNPNPNPPPTPGPQPQPETPAPSGPPTVQPQSENQQPIPAGGGGGAIGLIGLLGLRHLLAAYRRKKQNA